MTSVQLQPLRCLLEERGLAHWHDVVVDFACRWDGWQAHYYADDAMSPDHEPLQQVIEAVRTVPVLDGPPGQGRRREIQDRELACAEALACVDMTAWQAMVDQQVPQPWNPLEQPFLSFRQARGRLLTWEDVKTLWPRTVLRTWLLGRVKEHELGFAVSEV